VRDGSGRRDDIRLLFMPVPIGECYRRGGSQTVVADDEDRPPGIRAGRPVGVDGLLGRLDQEATILDDESDDQRDVHATVRLGTSSARSSAIARKRPDSR
jgi:hypothetical protein